MYAARIACLLLILTLLAVAQQQQPQPAPLANGALPAVPADLQELVHKQFGASFTVALQRVNPARYLNQPRRPAWNSLMTGDLDGDGVEDAVIVATARNPFGGQLPYHYAVVDPYFAAFGYGDPRLTSGLASEYPEGGGYVVLIIHGAGSEGWRAAAPKAKFVMINLPFNTINVAAITVGKKAKSVTALILEEDGASQSSIVFFDGKKYRWRDMGGPAS